MNTACNRNNAKETDTTLPSPPSSPIEEHDHSTSRKRAFSLSFIQNQQEIPTIKRQKFDLDCLRSFLKGNGLPNTCDKQFKRSLLNWACIGHSTEAIQDLTRLVHLDINLKSGPHHSTALHEACRVGFKEGVELLIEHADIDLNALDKCGQTPIHCATQNNNADCLQVLLSAGARIDLPNHQGRLPIHIAIQHGHQACVSHIMCTASQHQNNPTEIDMLWTQNNGRNSIELAIIAGYKSTLDTLLDSDVGTKQYQQQAGLAQLAVEWNRIECLQSLIQRGCLLDQASILMAVQQRKIDMVRELSTAGINPCLPNGQNPSFLYAANHGFLDMVPLLLTLKTSRDCIQQSLLLASCLGLRDQLAAVIVGTLKSKMINKT